MNGRVTRFLGDSPLRVLVRLLVISFIVGLALAALDLHPIEIYEWLQRLVARVYDMGFDAIRRGFGYMLLGALIVVPVFLALRLLRLGRGG